MAHSPQFWNRIAQRYAKKPIEDVPAYEKKLSVMMTYLAPHMKVLEIGCGTGSTAIQIAPLVTHIDALDISSEMLDIATARAQSAEVQNIQFLETDIDRFDAAPQSYDVVLGMSVLHLLEARDRSLASVAQLLKPGGYFISSTPCMGDFMAYFRYIAPVGQRLGLLPTVRVFTSAELEQAILLSGFSIDYYWRPSKNKSVFIVAKRKYREPTPHQ